MRELKVREGKVRAEIFTQFPGSSCGRPGLTSALRTGARNLRGVDFMLVLSPVAVWLQVAERVHVEFSASLISASAVALLAFLAVLRSRISKHFEGEKWT